MVKADWGLKRMCQHCGARFYDMRRDPITCPKCSAVFDPAVQLRPRRQAREEPVRPAPPPPVAKAVVEEEAAIGEVDDEVEEGAEEEEKDETIEDASELGEDDNDMAEVIEKVDGKDEP